MKRFLRYSGQIGKRINDCCDDNNRLHEVYMNFVKFQSFRSIKKINKFLYLTKRLMEYDDHLIRLVYIFLTDCCVFSVFPVHYYRDRFYENSMLFYYTPVIELYEYFRDEHCQFIATPNMYMTFCLRQHKDNFIAVLKQINRIGKREYWWGNIHHRIGFLNALSRRAYCIQLDVLNDRKRYSQVYEAYESLKTGRPLKFMIFCVNMAENGLYNPGLITLEDKDSCLGCSCSVCYGYDCFCELYAYYPKPYKFVVTNCATNTPDTYTEVKSDLAIKIFQGFYVELLLYKQEGMVYYHRMGY